MYNLPVLPSDASLPDGMAAPLTCFGRGQQVCISCINVEGEEAQRLRDLGLREGACVRLMANAALCVVGLGACRIALRHEVASRLFVTETL